ncbi:MAG: hypothetical protein FWH55_01160 [Oscillospiraceae bacterium]|nr:hypothetical protein [Oscillospiraceae bacterium]
MTDSSFDSKPSVFKELPKEQQKALRQEFSKISKAGRDLIIATVIMAAAMIILAIISIYTEDWVISGGVFPACMIPIFAASREDRFAKWLKAEKNIVMKIPKP